MKNPLKRKLQIRFILLSLAVLLALQSAIVTFSIWHSYRDMVTKSDVLLSQLRESPSANSRYFSVKVHPGKSSIRLDTTQNVTVTPTQASEYAKTVLHKDADRGFIDGYRYHIYTGSEGMRILFLSRHSSLEMHRSASVSLILFSAGGLALMAGLIILFSGIVVAPFVDSYSKQQQFITAAGHQLKTPLAVIRTQTQLLQDELGNNTWIDGILLQTDRLTQMTNDLIVLSRAEEYSSTLTRETFSLSDAATELVDIYAPLLNKKQISIAGNIDESLTYRGNENEIRQLLSILFENAAKYCPAGGDIRLTVKKDFSGIRIEAENTAENLTDANSELFSQRFFRGENAAGTDGFGLGLAIAQAIVQHHKGKMTIFTGNDTFRVKITLH